MKTTVDISTPLLNEVKQHAAVHGLSLRQLIETSLRRLLDTRQAEVTPFRLKNRTFKGEGITEGADWPTVRRQIYEGRGDDRS